MFNQRLGKMSPFKISLIKEDTNDFIAPSKNLENILHDAQDIENSLLKCCSKITESPKRQYLLEKVIKRSKSSDTPQIISKSCQKTDDLELKMLKHIKYLTKELEISRKKYKKLIQYYAEKKFPSKI